MKPARTSLQADRVPETRRAAAFGVFSGVCSAGFVASTVAARFLPASSTFQVGNAMHASDMFLFCHLPPEISGKPAADYIRILVLGAAGLRSGSRGDGRLHEGLPPGDGRRSLHILLLQQQQQQ